MLLTTLRLRISRRQLLSHVAPEQVSTPSLFYHLIRTSLSLRLPSCIKTPLSTSILSLSPSLEWISPYAKLLSHLRSGAFDYDPNIPATVAYRELLRTYRIFPRGVEYGMMVRAPGDMLSAPRVCRRPNNREVASRPHNSSLSAGQQPGPSSCAYQQAANAVFDKWTIHRRCSALQPNMSELLITRCLAEVS